jgi:hypothetical protein
MMQLNETLLNIGLILLKEEGIYYDARNVFNSAAG